VTRLRQIGSGCQRAIASSQYGDLQGACSPLWRTNDVQGRCESRAQPIRSAS
jgi:hypothetical protein